jgi:hypothetical protein
MTSNPADNILKKRSVLIDELTSENDRPRQRVRILEQEGAIQDLSMRVDANLKVASSKEVEGSEHIKHHLSIFCDLNVFYLQT